MVEPHDSIIEPHDRIVEHRDSLVEHRRSIVRSRERVRRYDDRVPAMRRHAFNLAALASAMLFLLIVALWWRSRSVEDSWTPGSAGGAVQIGLHSSSGSVIAGFTRISPPPPPVDRGNYVYRSRSGPGDYSDFEPPGPNSSRLKLPGFIYAQWTMSPPGVFRSPTYACHLLLFRDWLLASVFALLPSWWLSSRLIRSHRAVRAAREGAVPCPGCGYDLRATPRDAQGTRCPECGAMAS